jgi:hypothetical protein
MLSRRISLTIIRSGWLSDARVLTYTFSRSNATQTSVFSVAGTLWTGSFWIKSESGCVEL